MTEPKKYWFPAKRYGWGWGLPATWQGWVILGTWTAFLVAGAAHLLPRHPFVFAVFVGVMGGLLTLICYVTGEPPRWRWGDGS